MQVNLFGVVCATSLIILSGQVRAESWTLQSSIERASLHAPEIKLAENELEARQAAVSASSYWPNPTIDARIDNKLGLDDGSGGYDLVDMGITQPIPLKRLKYQKDFSQAYLQIAEHELALQRLELETQVAKEFHDLQFAKSAYQFASERLAVASELLAKSVKNKQGVIVRYMTPLEKMRLNIIREEAMQAESSAEGEYNEALVAFRKRLNIDVAQVENIAGLQQLTALPDVEYFLERQSAHANLAAQQQGIVAARAEVEVAKSRQLNDPVLRLSRSIDYFSQGKDDVYGLTLNVQIPLWNNKSPEVTRAEYNASQRHIEMQKTLRELQIQVKQSRTHLGHLVEQAEHHRQKVLQPSAEMLSLTNKGFISGELNLLTLIDAHNTYFDAQLRYSELLYQAWTEYADLRRAAGVLYASMPAAGSQNN